MSEQRTIAVVGLGYVGLPVALAFARKFPGTVGFDVNAQRIAALKEGRDDNGDLEPGALSDTPITFTDDVSELKGVDFFVVAVPTPIDLNNRPNLAPLEDASRLVGSVLTPGAIVVYESTVYPGVTEQICGPILAETSGLAQGKDFFLGYSPERINPGDREHTLERIVKVVAGENEQVLNIIAQCYEAIIEAGTFRASSIKVAEAAKVIENTQRDLNIALMNELALIFDRMNLRSIDVLQAAGTKWNFMPFRPGLVGGHCIGVDPYYLTTKAEQLGYQPQVILAGRRINDDMGKFIAQRTVKLLSNAGLRVKDARVGILGLTFKENVSDIRNSRIPDIIEELSEFGVIPLVHDPIVSPETAQSEFGVKLQPWEALTELDGLIYAVSHREFIERQLQAIEARLKKGGVLVDVKSVLDPAQLSQSTTYWSL